MRVLLLCLLIATFARASETVTVDRTTTYQTMQGWGACLYGNDDAAETYGDPRFRQAWVDAGFNIVRIPMVKEVLVHPSGDFSTPVRLADDLEANLRLMNFDAKYLKSHADLRGG